MSDTTRSLKRCKFSAEERNGDAVTQYRVIMETSVCIKVDADNEDDALDEAYDWIGETEISRSDWTVSKVFEVNNRD